MTSSNISQEEKEKFKKFFHRFVYGESNGYELLDSFESIPNLKEKLEAQNLT